MNSIKIFPFIAAIFILVQLNALAQFTESKQITKRFKASDDTRVEITNKYGKVKINTWDKDSVIFDIKIKVEDKKLSRLEKMVDEVDFDFTNSTHFIIARTKIGENKSSIEKEIKNFREAVFQSDGKVEVDYTVWMPGKNQLKVENKFGDVFIDDFAGDVEIILSNGNLKAHDFSGKASFNLNFADASVNKMKNGRLECNYSDFYAKEAEKLDVTSKSSEIEISEVKEINADSRRDKFRINMIDELTARGSFSNYLITEFKNNLNFKSEYGDLSIQKIAPDFNSVYIESKSTDLSLYFSEKSEFGFEITHTKSQTSFCRKMEIKKEEVLDEKEKKIQLTGNFGKNGKTNKLFINASGGDINISDY